MSKISRGHDQTFHVDALLHLWIPPHGPRESDPHYKLFNAAKRKATKLDVPCWRCGVRPSDLKRDGRGKVTACNPHGATALELHHSACEFSLQAGVDVKKFQADHPEFDISNEEKFLAWLESENNLLCLCNFCHRAPTQGIHSIPYPLWRVARVWRNGIKPLIREQR